MKGTALVTGSSTGIGLETALALARDGYRTFASMRDTSKSGRLEEAVGKEGLAVEVIPLDVDSAESAKTAVAKIVADTGRLDVLVNNAGYGQFGCTEDVPLEAFRKQFETNFFGVVGLIQEVAPTMRKQGSGAIINISSVAGRMGLPGSPAYISSKFALEGLGECLRYELAQFGIRTTLIEPGVIKTDFFESMRIPESQKDPKYTEMTGQILGGVKMMVQMGTAPSAVAEAVIRALHDEEMQPRYLVGTDAAMFMEARRSRTDAEFERFITGEIFARRDGP